MLYSFSANIRSTLIFTRRACPRRNEKQLRVEDTPDVDQPT